MPRPPILPTVDWQALFGLGRRFTDWLAVAEMPDHAARMQAIFDEQVVPMEALATLAALTRPVRVIAWAEDWCGDVVRHAPVLARLEASCPHLHVRFLPRGASPDTFARFLTNGGEAVPKFVFLNDKWVECGNWGPMETAARELIARGKACGDLAAARQKVKAIYEADPQRLVVARELAALVAIAGCDRP